MIIRKLEYLIALAKEQHFARAAAACHVSQPALSAGIQQLELELGVPIVKRGQRFQGFTEQGEVVLLWAQRLAVECQRLHRELRDMSAQLSGTLRIGTLHSAEPLVSMLALPFERAYPRISLRVIGLNPYEIQQGLEDFSLDVAITRLDDKLRRSCRTHELYAQEYDLLVRRGSKLSGRQSATWDEVKKLPLCLLAGDLQALGDEVAQILSEIPDGVPHLDTTSMFVLLEHVKSGKWVSVLSKTVQILVADDNQLEAIPLPRSADPVKVGIAMPNREPISHLAEAFFDIATSGDVIRKLRLSLHPEHTAA
jgi:DNA-binding transcriptional LysR family regulator